MDRGAYDDYALGATVRPGIRQALAALCPISGDVVAVRRNVHQDQRQWVYLYRGVDKEGQTIDFFLSEHRDIAAAKRFLQQAIEKRGIPQKITLDGYAASHVAVGELQEEERPTNRSPCADEPLSEQPD